MKRRFGLDKAELESRFYRLSRELHPDRFATAAADERRDALEKMSLVNEAYRTLKNPNLLRDYVLKLAGFSGEGATAKKQIPVELAESWFELQELLMEDPVEGRRRLEEFKSELSDLKTSKASEIRSIENSIDSKLDGVSNGGSVGPTDELAGARDLLARLQAIVLDLNYIESMEKDVERIRGQQRNVG